MTVQQDLAEKVRELEARIEELEGVHEIMNLEAEYARSWDEKEPDGWAAVFTDDGTFEMLPSQNTTARRYEGRQALSGFCRDTGAYLTGRHYFHIPHIAIDGRTASGLVYVEFEGLFRMANGEVQRGRSRGFYRVQYVKTPLGWRMKERVEQMTSGVRSNWFET